MKAEAGENTVFDDPLPDSTQVRMREGQINSISSNLMSTTTELHQIHMIFRNGARETMARRIKDLDTNNELSNDEIDRMVKQDPKALQTQIEKKLLGHKGLMNHVNDLREKAEEIKRLEQNVYKLLDIIKEISV